MYIYVCKLFACFSFMQNMWPLVVVLNRTNWNAHFVPIIRSNYSFQIVLPGWLSCQAFSICCKAFNKIRKYGMSFNGSQHKGHSRQIRHPIAFG